MTIDQRLNFAKQLLLAAIPDRSAWSGLAASSLEQRIYELITELDSVQGGLWR